MAYITGVYINSYLVPAISQFFGATYCISFGDSGSDSLKDTT